MNTAPPADPDPSSESYAATAEIERQRIVAESEAHAWRGQLLQPWARGTQTLYARLVTLDLPGGDLEDLPHMRQRFEELKAQNPTDATFDQCVDFDLYLPAATKVLFLVAVPGDQWFHLRGQPARLIAHIEAWGAENISDGEKAEACHLASRILTEHRAVMPMSRPMGGGHRSNDAGN